MSGRLQLKVLVANAAGARWVEWSEDHKGFVTVGEIKPPPRHVHSGPRQVVFESATPQRHGGVDPRDADHRREAFARELAQALNTEAEHGRVDRLGLAAPSRLAHAVKAHLGRAAHERLVLETHKNLGKTPDHELAAWLGRVTPG